MKNIFLLLVSFCLCISCFAQDFFLEKKHQQNLNNISINSESSKYNLIYENLQFEVNPAVKYLTGNITFYLKANTDLSKLVFDFNSSMNVNQIVYHEQFLTSSYSNNLLTINLPESIKSGTLDSIQIKYEGTPFNSGFGSFEIGTHSGTPMMWTLSEPYGARDWMPCKQDLNDKIDSIDLYLTCPQEYKFASNGVLVEENLSNQKYTAHWKHRYPIATYLIAFAVTNYQVQNDEVTLPDGTALKLQNFIFPESFETNSTKANAVKEMLKIYSELFIPYPFKNEKYGNAQFGWGGGMEHQTMTFVINFNASLLSHELAHQWFGDYITCASWKNIWLNEGFATYCEYLYYEKIGATNLISWKQNKVQTVTNYTDGSVIVDDTTNVDRIFSNRLSYAKGGMVLHQLRQFIGDEAFFLAIKNYLNDESLKNNYATTEMLKKHFEEASGKNLDNFFAAWIYGQGYPIYNISWTQIQNNLVKLKIQQSQSYPNNPFFPAKLNFLVKGIEKDTMVSFLNETNLAEYEIALNSSFTVSSIEFNPEADLLTADSNIANTTEIDTIVRIAPNPVTDKLTIVFENGTFINSIKLFDIQGNVILIKSLNAVENIYDLSTSTIPSGTYILEIQTTKGKILKKIIKIDAKK